jgi:hypothetical protein
VNLDKTFSEVVDDYITQADYLTDDDEPAVAALVAMANELDNGTRTPAMFNVFGVTLRALQKRKGDDAGPVDEAEAFLMNLG